MIIFNTTYHVMDEVRDEFMAWLREEYVPRALVDRMLIAPQLTKIIGSEQEGGASYALQFRAQTVNSLEIWHHTIGDALTQEMVARFGNKVVGFRTLMDKMEL